MIYIIKKSDLHSKDLFTICACCGKPALIELEFYIQRWDIGKVFSLEGRKWIMESEVEFKNRTK